MDTSVRWLNDYLDPPASAEEQAELLTRAGFPLEGTESIDVSDGTDVRQDFEMTSNRGDCVCHLGLAREVAAISGRSLKIPEVVINATGSAASDEVDVINEDTDGCPLYTARIIKGVKVGPSPAWLADRLTARGDIPRNNIVDATNFVLFEHGQPTHVFDLATLKGAKIIIRRATKDEPFLPIGEDATEIKLSTEDLVIADEERAVALAGVKGGALTAVTEGTTDILLEAATFSQVDVRNASRRHNIVSESGYRFERGVHAGQISEAADRLAALIIEVAGGTLYEGAVEAGRPIAERRVVTMRPARCRRILGLDISDEQMIAYLDRLGFDPVADGEHLKCLAPIRRLDIEREVDLIEEVGRMHGLDGITIADTIPITVAPPQPEVLAKRAVNDALVGMGFVESTTHSLVGEAHAGHFLRPGTTGLRVDDERAGAEPVLRPSIVPSLLRVRRHNRDNGVHSLKLFESASTYWCLSDDEHVEVNALALLMDMDDESLGVRPMRGVLDRLVNLLLGRGGQVEVDADHGLPWLSPGASVCVNGDVLGWMGVLSGEVLKAFDLDAPVLAAELALPRLYGVFPPDQEAQHLPNFPDIERDISAVLEEGVAWDAIVAAVTGLQLDHLEAVSFVTCFRGKQIGAGKKSVSLRLRFRAPDRTLRHEEVDPQIDRAMAVLTDQLGATIRR